MKYKIDLGNIIENKKISKYRAPLIVVLVLLLVYSVSKIQYTQKIANIIILEHTNHSKRYVSHLPKNILKQAEYIKPLYVKNKMADDAIDHKISLKIQHNRYEYEYEQAINTLYEGNINSKSSLQQILNLVSYAPSLFTDNNMLDLLMQQSKPLASFLINYQVTTIIKPENNINTDNELKEIIAEQSREIDNLKSQLNSKKLRKIACNCSK